MKNFLRILFILSLLPPLILEGCKQNNTPSPSDITQTPSLVSKPEAITGELSLYSEFMEKEIDLYIVVPNNYNDRSINSIPVLYLLHGAFGDHLDWKKNAPLQKYADEQGLLIICPDGHEFGWYLDSPVDSQFRYESFITQELLPWVEERFKTSGNRKDRAICGLSMGGHGALYLAFRHQDLWATCGGISGGMDLRPFPNNWNLEKRLGKQDERGENWLSYSVVGQLDLLEDKNLAIYFDCGTEDFFYEVNEALHDSLRRRGITHRYQTRSGEHNWNYFSASLPSHLEFFKKVLGE